MLHRARTNVKAVWCVLVLAFQLCASTSSTTTPQTPISTVATCPSRTINYITETLPQQCLRTDWTRNVTASETSNLLVTSEATQATVSQPLQTADTTSTTTTESSNTENSTAIVHTRPSQQSSEEEVALSPSAEHSSTSLISSTSSTTSSVSPDTSTDQDADPLSDNANFLSFEEWKSQMLKKIGQSAEGLEGNRHGQRQGEPRRRPTGVNQALDSLGDDTEIELDFSGFVNPESISEALPSAGIPSAGKQTEQREESPQIISKSKEAGTTSKERTNYASFDCAATVLKTNNECRGPTSILLENKDSYMLNPCSVTNKFFILELCNDILIDTIALGNYEFFSSTFRTFRVSISDRYPVKPDKWRELGTFEARNTRGVQAFLVENGLIWARYLRVEFLTHYGIEHYCPVSVIRVHGKTMIDDYRNDVKAARGDEDVEEEATLEENGLEVKIEKIAPIITEASTATESDSAKASGTQVAIAETNNVPSSHREPDDFKDKCPRTNFRSPLVEQTDLLTSACSTTRNYCNLELTARINSTARVPQRTGSSVINNHASSLPLQEMDVESGNTPVTHGATGKSTENNPADTTKSLPSENDSQGSGTASVASDAISHTPTASQESPIQSQSKTVVQPPPAAPSTQESFFKSLHKRLQMLEANSTLSLQYIEEQSRILREAFTKVEKRQLNKTSTFLESLNATVLGELREFRLQYDQVWQSTILELSSQREASQREALALGQRMTILAEEVLWQKRLVYLQFGLILLCLGLLVFSRGNSTPYLELPVLQGMVQKSTTGFSRHLRFDSPPDTPSRPGSRYSVLSRKSVHYRSGSESTTKSPSPGGYQSPTPPTEEEGDSRVMRVTESPEPPEPELRRAISSPALGQATVDTEPEDVSLGPPSPTSPV